MKQDIAFHMLVAQASQNRLLVALGTLANEWTASTRALSRADAPSRRAVPGGTPADLPTTARPRPRGCETGHAATSFRSRRDDPIAPSSF